jgi:hypothetical protein
MAIKAHSTLGGSGAGRWMACPGSVAFAASLPEPPSSKYADEGSAAHELGEWCLRNGESPFDYIGHVFEDYPEFPVTEEMAAAVVQYVDFCNSFSWADSNVETWIEKPFCIWAYDYRFWGTSDFGCYMPASRHLHVVDYKHGAGVKVYVKELPQLLFYGLGALGEIAQPVDRVTLHIVQPRAGHKDAINSWSTTPERLHRFGAEAAAAALETDKPGAERVAGPWCRWCAGALLYKCDVWMGWQSDLTGATRDFFNDDNTQATFKVSGRRARSTTAEADFSTIAGLI